MKHILSIFLLLTTFVSHGQTGSVAGGDPVYQAAEQMPQAGYDINEYLSNNLRYPDSAGIKGIQGRVIVRFVVNKDGSIDSCSVKRGIGGGCDEEALRVLKAMPPWKPGMQNGQPVRVSFSMPVKFAIDTSAIQQVAVAEHRPVPPFNFNEYIDRNLNYPVAARKDHIQGEVVIQFLIGEDGSISGAEVLNGIGYGCDQEALRLIKDMPKWKPGMRNGNPIKTVYVKTVVFNLDAAKTVSEETAENIDPGIIAMPKVPKIYTVCERPPQPGYSINEYLANNLHYPKTALKNSVQDRVVVQFVVNEDGSISNAKVLRGINAECNDEALRVIKKMPPWKPGTHKGEAVKVYFSQPISFKLN